MSTALKIAFAGLVIIAFGAGAAFFGLNKTNTTNSSQPNQMQETQQQPSQNNSTSYQQQETQTNNSQSQQQSNCDPNYTGACVPNVYPQDVDCAGGSGNGPYYVQGPVKVVGVDRYGLDRDGNGVGCE